MSVCAQPIRMLDTSAIASRCGTNDGYFWALLISLGITGYEIYYYLHLEDDKDEKYHTLYWGIAAVIAIFLFLPHLFSLWGEYRWNLYESQVQSHKKSGLTQQEALNRLEGITIP